MLVAWVTYKSSSKLLFAVKKLVGDFKTPLISVCNEIVTTAGVTVGAEGLVQKFDVPAPHTVAVPSTARQLK